MVRLFGGPPPGLYEKMMSFLAKHLVYTENYLNHGKTYIYGDNYTAADCLLTPLLHRVNEMRFHGVFDGKNSLTYQNIGILYLKDQVIRKQLLIMKLVNGNQY